MISLSPGSHTEEFLKILSLVGEFPMRSLSLLGSQQSWMNLIYKLTKHQDFSIPQTGEIIQGRMLGLSGKGNLRTIRLTQTGASLLQAVDTEAYVFYARNFSPSNFTGDIHQLDRKHRFAEAVVMLRKAGIEVRPYKLPPIQIAHTEKSIPDTPCMYPAKALKLVGSGEEKKTMFSRLIGEVFSGGQGYAVFNTRNAQMKWHGLGELKMKYHINEIARMNAGIQEVDSAILFGANGNVALKTLLAEQAHGRKHQRFDDVYYHIHFVPLDANGIEILHLLIMPNARETILSALFSDDIRSYDLGLFGYDARMDNTVFLSHLDGDINALYRFREAQINFPQFQYTVLCFPWQKEYVETFLGDSFHIQLVSLGTLVDIIQENQEEV